MADPENQKINSAGASLRRRYEIEVEEIKSKYGDLDDMRQRLGLNQRQVCMLLLVDPSAWTRWQKSAAPPHVYKALQWLVQLHSVEPTATDSLIQPGNLSRRLDFVHTLTQGKIAELKQALETLKEKTDLAFHHSEAERSIKPQQKHSFTEDTAALLQRLELSESRLQQQSLAWTAERAEWERRLARMEALLESYKLDDNKQVSKKRRRVQDKKPRKSSRKPSKNSNSKKTKVKSKKPNRFKIAVRRKRKPAKKISKLKKRKR